MGKFEQLVHVVSRHMHYTPPVQSETQRKKKYGLEELTSVNQNTVKI
jgi:hypothetical protein